MENSPDNVGIPWLINELKDLKDQNLLSPEAATTLEKHYRPKALAEKETAHARMHLYLISLLSGIAALLLVGGIILILNYNWEGLSRPMRTVVAVVPTLVGLGLTAWIFTTNKSRPWREFTGIWLMLSTYSSFGIIAQTYNLGGRFASFMMVVTLTTLFVPVLLRSLGANIIQLISFIVWAASVFEFESIYHSGGIIRTIHQDILICLGLALALIPYYLVTKPTKNTWERRFDSIALVITTYFIVPLLLSRIITDHSHLFVLLLLVTACAQLLVGYWIKSHGDAQAAKPWHVGGWVGLAMCSNFFSGPTIRLLGPAELTSWWLIPLIGLAAYATWRTIRKEWFATAIGLLPLVVFGIMLYYSDQESPIDVFRQTGLEDALFSLNFAPLLMSITFILFSISSMVYGYVEKDGGIFTGATVILLFAIATRFTSGEFSTLTRGIVFILAGLITLAITIATNRRFKKYGSPLYSEKNRPLPIIAQPPLD